MQKKSSPLSGWRRSHVISQIDPSLAGQDVTVMGWVHKRRDHGQVIFVDLRDRSGLAQVVFDPAFNASAHAVGAELRNEYVIAVRGQVVARPDGMTNKNLSSGAIEIHATEAKIINVSEPLPIQIAAEENEASETLRLKYRYLDIRRPSVKNILLARSRITSLARQALEAQGFIDIETPMLYKSTPEGAREFLVPSRIHPGEFYALPQSPQLFKQILMVAGMDRYYQIVKCFRDEDLRADRQPEFSQIDCEMSFVEQEEILETFEKMIKSVVEGFKGIKLEKPFVRMSYADAMENYGNDKPDIRFDLRLQDLSALVAGCDFKVFDQAVATGGIVNALLLEGAAEKFSRKDLDRLTELNKQHGGQGLAWVKRLAGQGVASWQSPIAKFFDDDRIGKIEAQLQAKEGDLILFGAGPYEPTKSGLSAVRNQLGKDLQLYTPDSLSIHWIVDFPLLEKDHDSGRWIARHHPFTMPREEDLALLATDPAKVRANAYDLVINGYEIGGGSLRIYDPDVQQTIFNTLGLSLEEAVSKFGFLLEALKYGAPPHGGIAFGLDRLVMVLLGLETIRDVVPFPKTNKASCLMTASPNVVTADQLRDLHIRIQQQTL